MTAQANSTVLRWAASTDVGRVRTNNEDRYLTQPGLWVVADGMGGHRGGEIASRMACESLGAGLSEHSVDGLLDAIEAANTVVHTASTNDPDLAGMGTTVVAVALVLDEGEEVLAVANVGDSRVYRLTGGELEQLTDDHSLVAEMVREGSISAEEATTHPQRNILTRVLGVYDEIPVDVLTVLPRHGDRFVLCSDGLFNEVTEEAIAAVLRRLADPGDAADELVRLAVDGGGRDNVTVVVVDVVSDGAAGAAAVAALTANGETTTRDMGYAGGAYTDDETVTPGRSRRLRSDDAAVEERPRHRRRGERDGAKPRRFTWRVALFILILVAVVGGAFATIQYYGRSTYYVGLEGDQVAIYRGRPGGVLWVDPSLVDTTELAREDVPDDVLDTLVAGHEVPTLEEATDYVNRLERRIDRAREAAATTTTTTTSTTIPTTVPATQPPVPVP